MVASVPTVRQILDICINNAIEDFYIYHCRYATNVRLRLSDLVGAVDFDNASVVELQYINSGIYLGIVESDFDRIFREYMATLGHNLT